MTIEQVAAGASGQGASPSWRAVVRAVLVAALVLCAFPPGPALAGEARVERFIASDLGRGVELRLEMSEPAAFTFFTLDAPRRLVLDYASGDGRGPEGPLVLPGEIGTPRFGLFTPERARVVVPLNRAMAVSHASGSGSARFTLRLAPVTPERFAAAAGWPEGARWSGEGVPMPPPRRDPETLVIAIDPGHGGIDPGAEAGGLTEKWIVLGFSRRLARLIDETPGFDAVLTRDRDVFLPLGERVRRAQRAGAHIFLSIHADSVIEGVAEGLSVYSLAPEASDAAAARLVARENRADLLAGSTLDGAEDDVARVLVELAQRGTVAESERLAGTTLDAWQGSVEVLSGRPHRHGNFRVLKAPDIPSLLIELGFLTSDRDRARITDADWQERAARGILRGIRAWAEGARPGWRAPRG